MSFLYPKKEIKIKLIMLGSLVITSINGHIKLDTAKIFTYLGFLALSQKEENGIILLNHTALKMIVKMFRLKAHYTLGCFMKMKELAGML